VCFSLACHLSAQCSAKKRVFIGAENRQGRTKMLYKGGGQGTHRLTKAAGKGLIF
jgi:hypothetical protein